MLQHSVIIRFVMKIFNQFCWYLKHSSLYPLLTQSSRFWAQVRKGSAVVRFFFQDWKEETAWTHSMTHKVVMLPVRMVKWAGNKLDKLLENSIRGSLALSSMNDLLTKVFEMSTKVFGMMLLAFTLTEGLLWLIFRANDAKGILLRGLLVVCSVVLITINRSLKSLYEGSWIARMVGSFFTA